MGAASRSARTDWARTAGSHTRSRRTRPPTLRPAAHAREDVGGGGRDAYAQYFANRDPATRIPPHAGHPAHGGLKRQAVSPSTPLGSIVARSRFQLNRQLIHVGLLASEPAPSGRTRPSWRVKARVMADVASGRDASEPRLLSATPDPTGSRRSVAPIRFRDAAMKARLARNDAAALYSRRWVRCAGDRRQTGDFLQIGVEGNTAVEARRGPGFGLRVD